MIIERLYKYGRLNKRSKKLFSTSKIWFSCPFELNDPFECRPRLTLEGTEKQIVESHSRMIQKHNPRLSPQEVAAEANAIYRQERHKDPQVLDAIQGDLFKKVKRDIGLYCMSKVRDSILMWSHYAKNHEGYCLEFEATDYTPFFGMAQEVKYSDDYPIIEQFNTPSESAIERLLFTKYKGWEYEHEWRIADHKNGSGWREYPPELLKGVIFGVRMSEDNKAKIRKWVGLRGHAVQFYQAEQHEEKYSIEVKAIP